MARSGNPAVGDPELAAAKAERDERDARRAEVAADAADGTLEDFDAFWSGRKRKPKVTRIMGVDVHLPPSLPLQFELEARKSAKATDEASVKRLVAILFGDDPMDQWAEAGMDLEQFQVLLAWAPRAIAGNPLPLAEVADMVAREGAKAAADDEDEAGEADPT